MRAIITIVSILLWQSSFAQSNDCRYNQLDSAGLKHGTWIYEMCTPVPSYGDAHRGKICITWGHYEHGKRTFLWHYWENGFLTRTENYNKHQNTVFITHYYPSNIIKEESNYTIFYGAADSIEYEIIDDETGKAIRTIEYRYRMEKTGTWKHYSINGKLEKVETY